MSFRFGTIPTVFRLATALGSLSLFELVLPVASPKEQPSANDEIAYLDFDGMGQESPTHNLTTSQSL